LLAVRERFTHTLRLQMQLARGTNVRNGLETIRQCLLEDNLHIRRPATGPLLTVPHQQASLQFAENHARWNDNEWARILVSDESRFCLESSDRRVRVIQCNILTLTDLHVFARGTKNSTVYLTDILKQYQMVPQYHLPDLSGIISSSSMRMQDRTVPELCPSI
jgi:hypothetical protein